MVEQSVDVEFARDECHVRRYSLAAATAKTMGCRRKVAVKRFVPSFLIAIFFSSDFDVISIVSMPFGAFTASTLVGVV